MPENKILQYKRLQNKNPVRNIHIITKKLKGKKKERKSVSDSSFSLPEKDTH